MQFPVLIGASLMADGAGGGGGGGSSPILLIGMLLIFVFFYLFMIRPQQKEQGKRKAMLAAMKKNDRVVTVGGIYGVVANIRPEADEVTLKVDEATNTKIRITLGSIARVVEEGSGGDSSAGTK